MARNASGTYTLHASNPVTTQTVIDSSDFNDTMTDLETEMTDSLNRSGKGAMLAGLKIIDGTISAGGVKFDSEPTSGVYRAAAGDVRASVLGVDRLVLGPSTGSAKLVGVAADGGTAVGVILDNTVTLSTTAKCLSVRNNTSEKFYIGPGGQPYAAATDADTITWTTNWSNNVASYCRRAAGLVMLHINAVAGADNVSTQFATLSAGYRPPYLMYHIPGAWYDGGTTLKAGLFSITTGGVITLDYVLDNTPKYVAVTTGADVDSTDTVHLTCCFPVV